MEPLGTTGTDMIYPCHERSFGGLLSLLSSSLQFLAASETAQYSTHDHHRYCVCLWTMVLVVACKQHYSHQLSSWPQKPSLRYYDTRGKPWSKKCWGMQPIILLKRCNKKGIKTILYVGRFWKRDTIIYSVTAAATLAMLVKNLSHDK